MEAPFTLIPDQSPMVDNDRKQDAREKSENMGAKLRNCLLKILIQEDDYVSMPTIRGGPLEITGGGGG